MLEPIISQFDQVELYTTKRVSYLSSKPGSSVSPHGLWSVVGIIDNEVLLAKEGALIRIPLKDIKKVATYSTDAFLNKARRLIKHGKEEGKEED